MLRKLINLLAIAVFAHAASAQVSAPMPEDCFPDLRAIIEGMYQNSPDLLMNSMNTEEGLANLDSAKGYRGPRITGFARMQAQYENRFNSESTYEQDITVGPYANITASLPIFHWGEITARIDIAKSRVEASQNWTRQRAAQIRQDIRKSYIEYQLALKSAEIARDDIANAQKKRDGMQVLADKGLMAKDDLGDVDIYIQSRKEDLAYSTSQSEYFLNELKESSGLASLDLHETAFPEMRMLTDAELLDLQNAASCAMLPSIDAMEAELAAEKASCKEISSRNRPKLDAILSGNMDYADEYRNNGKYENVPRAYAWGGIQASWTIYDRGTNNADRRASMIRQRRIEQRIEQAKITQTHDVANIANDARLNASRTDTRRTRLALLSTSVDMMEAQFEQKGVSANDLFQRKLDLRKTEMDLLRAQAYYLLDVAQMREIAGFCETK
jgi:outer membrane protein TolC